MSAREWIAGIASTFAPLPERTRLGTLEDDWRAVGDDLRKAMAMVEQDCGMEHKDDDQI
jgi:hypothetical protein